MFLGHFSCHWIIAIHWPASHLKNFPKGFPGGVGNLEWAIHILAWTVCTRCLCTQTKPTNQTKPELHQPGVTLQRKPKAKWCPEIKSQVSRVPQKDGKGMSQNEKTNGINAKHDFPVQLDLKAGKASASSLFSSNRFKQFLVDFLGRSYSIISCFRSF